MAQQKILATTITIASGTDTDVIDLQNRVLVGVQLPASVASTAMTIDAAYKSDATFAPIYDGLGQYGAVGDVSFTVAASKYVLIPPTITAGISFVKLSFGTSETAKTYTYFTREID
jgi:hypothetical protein